MSSQNKKLSLQQVINDDDDLSAKDHSQHAKLGGNCEDSQIDYDNSIAQVIKGLELDGYQDLDNSQVQQVINGHSIQEGGAFPMSNKSQQNQSFIMNNSILQLNNAEFNEERGSLNSGKFKNQNSAKTNVYSNNTSLILNGSIIDDNSIKSPSLKKNIKIGKEFQGEQSYEINVGNNLYEADNNNKVSSKSSNNHQSSSSSTQPQNQLKSVLKKPNQLPPIQRPGAKPQVNNNYSSNRSSIDYGAGVQMQNMSNNNSHQNSVIFKGNNFHQISKDNSEGIANGQEVDHQQIALNIIPKDQLSLNQSQVSSASKKSEKELSQSKKSKRNRCLRILFPKIKLRSTVTAMCALFVIFFIIQLILESTTKQKRACTAYKIGCEFQPSITNSGEVYRLLLSSVLQASWFNIISTVFTFLFYGYVLESHFGVAKMIWVYVTCAFSGNIFVGVIEPYEIQIGSNSIVMGLFMLEIAFLYTIRRRIPKSKKKPILGMFVLLVVSNFLCIIESLTVKASSYLGGIIAGVFLAFSFYKASNPSKKFVYAQKASLVVLAIIELSMFIIAMTKKLDDIQISGLSSCEA